MRPRAPFRSASLNARHEHDLGTRWNRLAPAVPIDLAIDGHRDAGLQVALETRITVDQALDELADGRGLDIDLLKRIRAAAPDLRLIAGGGVREWDDLVRVAKSGCNGALLATALHNGRIGAAEIAEAQKL